MQSSIIKMVRGTNVMGENRIVCQVKIHFEAFLNINTVLLCEIISINFRKWIIL